jgi:hypothetical protein
MPPSATTRWCGLYVRGGCDGNFNIIVSKGFFENNKLIVKRCKFFLVEGKLQSEDDVIHIQAKGITQLSSNGLVLSLHDFH